MTFSHNSITSLFTIPVDKEGDMSGPALKAKSKPRPAKVPVIKEALSELAYKHIVDLLLTSRLSPGDLINRRQIAADLKISVAPVLEAMLQLENDGFLQSIPRKGTLVKSIKPEDVRGELILREAFECQAARLYCGAPVRAERERLAKLARAVEASRGNEADIWQAEFNFHYALVQLTECPALIRAYEKVMRRKLYISLNIYLQVHPESYHDDHLQLLDALTVADPDLAEHAMRRHFIGKAHIVHVPALKNDPRNR
jgi:DNA-binding GntR family transcriptional regulator